MYHWKQDSCKASIAPREAQRISCRHLECAPSSPPRESRQRSPSPTASPRRLARSARGASTINRYSVTEVTHKRCVQRSQARPRHGASDDTWSGKPAVLARETWRPSRILYTEDCCERQRNPRSYIPKETGYRGIFHGHTLTNSGIRSLTHKEGPQSPPWCIPAPPVAICRTLHSLQEQS